MKWDGKHNCNLNISIEGCSYNLYITKCDVHNALSTLDNHIYKVDQAISDTYNITDVNQAQTMRASLEVSKHILRLLKFITMREIRRMNIEDEI